MSLPTTSSPKSWAGSLDRTLLASLPTVPLRARYLVECYLAGRHRSPFKGTAPEFAEYRPYQAGDDIRRIDWRLYGRSDRLGVKQFEDESQLRICLALDLSASMRYASREGIGAKFDVARTLLAAVSLIGRRQHDAVGLALLGEADSGGGLREFVRPGSSASHHAGILNRLDDLPEARTAALGPALQRLGALLSPGSLLVLASDLYAEVEELGAPLRFLRSRRIELLALQVLDPMELDFDLRVAGRFLDLEAGDSLALNSAACRAGYLRRFGAFRMALAETFRRSEAALSLQRTDGNPLESLAAYLDQRERLVR